MIKSVQKAMDILKILSDNAPNSTSLKSIAEKTGITKPTCVHILNTLCQEGYVIHSSHTLGYKIGPAIHCLTRYGKYKEDLISTCHPILLWLSKKTNYISGLSVIENHEKYIIDHIDNENAIYTDNADIFTDDIYRTASGRIILSHMENKELQEFYDKYGNPSHNDWANITSFDELILELKKVRTKKIVYTSTLRDSLYDIGIATAIFKKSKCVGAIGLATRSANDDVNFFKNDVKYLKKAANEITRRLNYTN